MANNFVFKDSQMCIRDRAIPASPAEMENASSLYLVILMPMDSAAMRLSRIAMMARPVRELSLIHIRCV